MGGEVSVSPPVCLPPSRSSLFLTYSLLIALSCHPRCPNSSTQSGAGRSRLTDQNALFSEFSPFTHGEREAATLGGPRPCGPEPRTQHRPDEPGCVESHGMLEITSLAKKKKTRRNKQKLDVAAVRQWGGNTDRCECQTKGSDLWSMRVFSLTL